MYEENQKCLPGGDASTVFADQLAEIRRRGATQHHLDVTPRSVARWADRENQPAFAAICRRLLLPGSGIRGLANLRDLVDRARDGQACLLCLNHRSNLDVPTLYALLEDHRDSDLFHRIIWIAGRKLEEDGGMTAVLIQCVNRLIVTPRWWFEMPHSDEQLRRARIVNIAAKRAIVRLRRQGWVFALFPTGTRMRPDDASTQEAIGETHSYLRIFQYLAHCYIDGCTLPVSKDRDFTRETPRLDRVIYSFGPVHRTNDWLAEAHARFPQIDQPSATARAMIEDIQALAPAAPVHDHSSYPEAV